MTRPVSGAAKGPTQVSPRGWREILTSLWRTFNKDRVLALAAGVAFYAILAIFPALAAMVALYGLFADPTAIAAHLDTMNGVVPGGGIDVLRDQLTHVSSAGQSTLGISS